MKITIRQAKEGDIPTICEILVGTDLLHATHLPDLYQPTENPSWRIPMLNDFLRQKEAVLLVALNDHEEIVGTLYGQRLKQQAFLPHQVPRDYAFVEFVTVPAKLRQQGIGSSLVEAFKNWAKDQGLKRMELCVFNFNQASLKFFKKMGFQPFSTRFLAEIE